MKSLASLFAPWLPPERFHDAREVGYRMAKRACDVALSTAGILATAPIMVGAAVAIRATMGGPVLFRQPRPGYLGRSFMFYKFRTIRHLAEGEDAVESHGARVTNLGRFLRKSSIDELPNLFNVLKGDMSLVGPRPLLLEHVPRYSLEQFHRHDVLPGITGWAQINGRNDVSWETKFAHDLWYVENRSLLLDAKILYLTVYNVLFSKGVTPDGYPPMPDFRSDALHRASSETQPSPSP